jgi:hypothetical protein
MHVTGCLFGDICKNFQAFGNRCQCINESGACEAETGFVENVTGKEDKNAKSKSKV